MKTSLTDLELFNLFIVRYGIYVKNILANDPDTKSMYFCLFVVEDEVMSKYDVKHIIEMIRPEGAIAFWWKSSDYESRLEYLSMLIPVLSRDGVLERVIISDQKYVYKRLN